MDKCSRGLLEEYYAYTTQNPEKLLQLRHGSKQWWRVPAQLMDKSAVSSGVAALQDGDDWVLDPLQKANLLERTFASKCNLPLLEHNEYSSIGPPHLIDGFLRIRDRDVLRVLMNLQEDSATGPDQIAALVLKTYASALALPLALFARRILAWHR